MNSQTRRDIRFGLIALALAALLITLGIPLRGPVDLADADLGSYIVQAATSPNYVTGWTIILVGGVLQLYGSFGLYRYLTYRADNRIAFLALVLRIVGFALALPLLSFLAVSGPVIADLYHQGNQEVIAVVEANFSSGLGLVLLGVAVLAAIISWLLFAIAIWRDGRLAKWTVVLLVLGLLQQGVPASTIAFELLGLVLVLISTGTWAWKGWQESAPGAGQ